MTKYNDSEGVWRTISGRKVFIKEGQSLADAMKESGKFETKTEVKKAEATPKEEEKSKTPVKEYKSRFNLEAPVNDLDEAQGYLDGDDMTQYVPDELKDVITSAKWELEDEEGGYVKIQTNRELTEKERDILNDWIDGQNSDGLGEGFEQQNFATSYFNPETGDGPFTYAEYEEEIQRIYDEMDPRDYLQYVDSDVMDTAIDNYIEENYDSDRVMQLIEDDNQIDDEERERLSGMDVDELRQEYPGISEAIEEEAKDEIEYDPESYIDMEDIDRAKDQWMEDNVSREQDWYAMSSMRRNGDFEESDIDGRDLDTMVDDFIKNNPKWEEGIYDEEEADKMFEKNGSRTWDVVYDRMYEKGHNAELKETLKEDAKRDLGIEPGSDEESTLNELYETAADDEDDTDWSRYEEFIDDLKKNRNKGMNYEEWLKEKSGEGKAAKQYKSDELEQGKPYSIDYGNGIEKTAIFVGKDENGNNMFYDGEGIDGRFEFTDRFINDGRIKISDNKDDETFMRLYNELPKETKTSTEPKTSEKSEIHKKLEKDMGEELVEHTNDQGKKWYSSKSLDDEEKATRESIGKEHKNVFSRSDAEIDDAIQTFNDFKEYETFSNDEWNYANQEKRDKLAKDAIKNYLNDNHLTREEMLDLADAMENENYHTEAGLLEEVYNEVNGKTMNETNKKIANHLENVSKVAKEMGDEKGARTNQLASQYAREQIKNETPEKTETKKSSRWVYENWGEDYHKSDGETYSEISGLYSNQSTKPKNKNDELKYYRTDYKIDKNGNIDYNSKKETVYNTLEEAKRGKAGNQITDKLQEKAYKKYLKEHPRSKMSFEEFLKK